MISSVEVTKSLRNKNTDLASRISIANEILNNEIDVLLPRRESVILEWCFNCLITDNSASENAELWELLASVFPRTPETAQLRVFKNNRLLPAIGRAITDTNSTALLDSVHKALLEISTKIDLFLYSNDLHISQLCLTYLKTPPAVKSHALSNLLFTYFEPRTNLFLGKIPSEFVNFILNEPDLIKRRKFLTDFIRSDHLTSIKLESDRNVNDLVWVIENDKLIIEIVKQFPKTVINVFKIMNERGKLSAEFLNTVINIWHSAANTEFGYEIVNICLEIHPIMIFEDKSVLKSLIKSNPPSFVWQKLLLSASSLRSLTSVFEMWDPSTTNANNQLDLDLFLAAKQAVETLSPLQLHDLIQKRPPSLLLLLNSMSYEQCNSSLVQNECLKDLVLNGQPEEQIVSLMICPQLASICKPRNAEMMLRCCELQVPKVKFDWSVIKAEVNNYDHLLLRFFPVITACCKPKHLRKLVSRSSEGTREVLANNNSALELDNLREVLIDVLIDLKEFKILRSSMIQKVMYNWSQRHALVSGAISLPFNETADLVGLLGDSGYVPDLELMIAYCKQATPLETELLVSVLRPYKRDYVLKVCERFVDWQQCVIRAGLNELDEFVLQWLNSNYTNVEYMEPAVHILTSNSVAPRILHQLVVNLVNTDSAGTLHPKLFTKLCDSDLHWSIITAVFLASNSVFKSEFQYYLEHLSKNDLDLLFMTSVENNLCTVLECLYTCNLVHESRFKYNSVVIAKNLNSYLGSPSVDFWHLVDLFLRSKESLLNQFSIELLIEFIISNDALESRNWDAEALVLSRLLTLKRRVLRLRLHLVAAAFTSLMSRIESEKQASSFARLIDNLCNPSVHASTDLMTPKLARERRIVMKYAGTILHNCVYELLKLSNTNCSTDIISQLRLAFHPLVALVGMDGLKIVSVGMDGASRAYSRTIFEEYRLHKSAEEKQ